MFARTLSRLATTGSSPARSRVRERPALAVPAR